MEEKWVSIFDLLNKSKHQTIGDLFDFLKEKGLSDGERASKKAYDMQFAKLESGKERWNLKNYIEMMKSDKKVKKLLSMGKDPHPKMYARALVDSDMYDEEVIVVLDNDNELDNIKLDKCISIVKQYGFKLNKKHKEWRRRGWLTVGEEKTLIKKLQLAGIVRGSLANIKHDRPMNCYYHARPHDKWFRITVDQVFENQVGGS
jgi:hypothetical protein